MIENRCDSLNGEVSLTDGKKDRNLGFILQQLSYVVLERDMYYTLENAQ